MWRWFIITGVILVVIGLILYLVPNVFNWFGRLPGDIRIEKPHSKIFIPVTSMIIISIVLTILVNVIRFLFRK